VNDAHNCSATASVTITQPAVVLTATVTLITNVDCKGNNDGGATVTAAGGTTNYTYAWAPSGGTANSATGLSAGSYTITVTDAHLCTATASLTITQPALSLTANISSLTNVDCFGNATASTTVTAGGGTTPYTYAWTPSGGNGATANNLTAGTYTITVNDAHNCSATASVTITQPAAPLSANITATTNVDCRNNATGSSTVAAGGGTTPYTYAWTPSGGNGATASNLTAGTYTITVNDAHNCSATASVTITQPAVVLTATVTAATNIDCKNNASGSATVSVAGGTMPYTYAWTPSGGSAAIANNLTAGTYTVTVTDAHNCSASASVTLTQPTASLTATLIASNNVDCNGNSTGSAHITASGGTTPYTYAWTPSGGSSATASNLTAGTYTITVSDAHACTASTSVTITQPAVLTANITASTNVDCKNNATGSATVTAGGGTIAYTYAWTPSGGNAATANNLTSGTYTITVTDAHACIATASVTITQPTAVLSAAITATTHVSCNAGNNGSATVSAGGGTTNYTYAWTPSGGSAATANNLTAGAYTIMVTDAHLCTATATVTITQPTVLSASVSTTTVWCNGGSNGTATSSVSGGVTPYTYSWAPSGGSGAIANGLTTGVYTVTVTDANACNQTASVSITQLAILNVTTGSIVNVTCNSGNNGSASANATGGTLPYSYSWAPSGGASAIANGLKALTYTITVTDFHGCTATATATITEPTAVTATITSKTNASCFAGNTGSATVLAGGGNAPYTYAWIPYGGNTTTANNLTPGIYTITVTDNSGCKTSTIATISEPPPVTTRIAGPDSICSGANFTLTASGTGGNGTYSYNWSAGPGTGSTYNVSPVNTTTYTVTATDGNGCPGDTASLTVKTLKLTASAVTVSPTQTMCIGDSASIYANVNTSSSGNVNVSWSNGHSGAGTFKVSPPTTTTYTVTVSNMCGDTVVDSVQVIVNPLPVINIINQAGAACVGVTLSFKDTNTANEGSTYLWNFGDGQTSTDANPTHTYTSSGSFTVTVTVTSTVTGCSNTATAISTITIYPSPVTKFTANPDKASVVNPVISFEDNSTFSSIWYWSFGDGGNSADENPTHTYPAVVGDYLVKLVTTNQYGCIDSAMDSVYILPDFRLFIPSAFTPNGDELNDVFTAVGIGIKIFHMMIFDRWGNLIYTTGDIAKGWNGRVGSANKPALEDTYVYKIEVTDVFNEGHSYIGAVTLIK